jgi:hypothetical protein
MKVRLNDCGRGEFGALQGGCSEAALLLQRDGNLRPKHNKSSESNVKEFANFMQKSII